MNWLASSLEVIDAQDGEFWLDRAVQKKHLACTWSQYKDEEADAMRDTLVSIQKKVLAQGNVLS